MVYLSKQDVLRLHEKVLVQTGGMSGVRDDGLLESAVMSCQQTFDGADLYPGVFDKSAALACALSRNHPFLDGNKRTSILAALVMMRLNGFHSFHSQDQLAALGMRLANVTNGSYAYEYAQDWFRTHARLT